MKNFAFIEGKPASRQITEKHPRNENSVPEPRDSKDLNPLQASQATKNTCSILQQPKPSSQQNEIPSTPSARIPLADLIGDTERPPIVEQFEDESPQDTVRWNASRTPRSSQTAATPARGKKRARSSSPPSTARQPAKKAFKVYTGAVTTPLVDPATDLWNRYTTGTSKETPISLLAESSSPKVVEEQAGSVSGLRRWTSCGVGWPASAIKRKRTRPDMIKDAVEDVFLDQPTNIRNQGRDVPNQRNPRIGSLLQRIQQSLTAAPPVKQHTVEKEPSSSSPTPEKHSEWDRQPHSPDRAPDIADRLHQQHLASDGTDERKTSDPGASFGSEMDTAMMEMAVPNQTRAVETATTTKVTMQTKSRSPQQGKLTMPDINEFDFEDDDDFDADDYEQMASLCDSATQPSLDAGAQAVTAGVSHRDRSSKPLLEPTKALPDEYDDIGYDDEDIDEASFAAAEVAATQSYNVGPKSSKAKNVRSRAIQRYLVVDVETSHYTDSRGYEQTEKIVQVKDETLHLQKIIHLRQSWIDTRCSPGSYVHVVGLFSRQGHCIVDDDHNILILHPDHLISATAVADSFTCLRRAVLQDRIKATSEASPPLIYGTMLHEIFQEAMTAGQWDDEFLSAIIATTIARHIEDIHELKLTTEHVTEHLNSKMPEVQSWARTFLQATPGPSSLVKERNDQKVRMSVSKILDVEEHVWSPMYGLKGNIDATVQINVQDDTGQQTLLAPFEVKTGRNSTNASHRAQTALYTLLLSDRYDVAVAYGILYYLETSETSRIPGIRHEIRHMIMQRNELACFVKERLELPPMIKSTHMCGKCYAKPACYIYHKLVEGGDGETSGMREKFDKVVRHLKPQHAEFFKKWEDLLTKEETEMMKFRRELWTMLSTEREKVGRCFANVMLEAGSDSEDKGSQKINRFNYTFTKRDEAPGFSFAESQMAVGEPIVISDESGHYALAKGYVTAVLPRRITVAVDRRLRNARTRLSGFNEDSNQVFSGITDSPNGPSTPILYRLDKDEFSNGMAMVRNNLVRIMDDDVFHAKDLRELIIDGRAPQFKVQSTAYTLSGPQSQIDINEDQKAAIEKIMTAEDYALVLGMPGTGKTTTIAHIIRALVAKGKSVLLTSYTHTAVDNILLKIKQDNISVLRLGATAKVHPEVREFATLGAEQRNTVEEVHKAYHEPQVVATTCLGINHRVFNERIFDYCIVDEASQITLPVCLGPIRMARAFVLVGDHYQLPPLVQNKEALEGGLDVSLFKLLSDMHPSAVAMLHHQYRMNEEIMSISNALIYRGLLVCGSEMVARRRLVLPRYDALSRIHICRSPAVHDAPVNQCVASKDCWLARALSPESKPVAFLNTDGVADEMLEEVRGSRLTNAAEASMTVQIVKALLLAGVDASGIGVITLYRSQLALIKSLLAGAITKQDMLRLEAHTTDRFQGRDKDVVVMSCVRSNDRAIVGDLLKDWRRVNVAITRAKKKLIIIGSKSTLSQGDELLKQLVQMCEERSWMVNLPARAHKDESHAWPLLPIGTQSSPAKAKVEVEVLHESASPTTRAGGSRQTKRPSMANALKPSTKVNKPFKAPSKIGKLSQKVAMGSENARAARPVLVDIVNDVVGEGFFD